MIEEDFIVLDNCIGIDPGKSGGIVAIFNDGVEAFKMPDTERDLWDLFSTIEGYCSETFAYIERVHSMPNDGGRAAFTFGQNYGMLRAFLIASEIPFEEVIPQKWQKFWSLPTLKSCGGSKTKKKNIHKAKAQQLFPKIKVTHAVADALLIAEYGRRMRKDK